MISYEKVVNNKVIEANDIYNFCIGDSSIRQSVRQSYRILFESYWKYAQFNLELDSVST